MIRVFSGGRYTLNHQLQLCEILEYGLHDDCVWQFMQEQCKKGELKNSSFIHFNYQGVFKMVYIKNTTGHDLYDHKSEFTFIENELLTKREFEIFCPSLSMKGLSTINISKNKTCRFFGVRFECHNSGE